MATATQPSANPRIRGTPSSPPTDRLVSIDVLRGIIMAIMALDHVKDYINSEGFPSDWTDPTQTNFAMFFTRWVTNFCAPAFFLLAGMGAYLSSTRKSTGEVARFLIVRGLFLIVLDVTVVRFAWDFNLAEHTKGLWFIVLSALGMSMIVLAGLIYLPRWAILTFSVTLIVGHNFFDGLDNVYKNVWEPFWPALSVPQGDYWWSPIWTLLHVQAGDQFVFGEVTIPFYISYPLIPWMGVMPLGYVMGPIMKEEGPIRRQRLLLLGTYLVIAFFILRAINVYGDPYPWSSEYGGIRNLYSFLRPWKYPPSLAYLLMTLGPIFLGLAVLDRARGSMTNVFLSIGRVPLFFYVAHLYLIHAIAVVLGVLLGFDPNEMCVLYTQLPYGYGFSLSVTYGVWLFVLLALYPFCAWFCDLKRRSKAAWLSYL
jgi:uncharacterized membrane protein